MSVSEAALGPPGCSHSGQPWLSSSLELNHTTAGLLLSAHLLWFIQKLLMGLKVTGDRKQILISF